MKDRAAPIVVALGGNALSPMDMEGTIAQQFAQTRQTVAGLVELLGRDAPMIITHGNGPQVGCSIRRVELSSHEVYPLDLGLCVANTQGVMGYMIAQSLMNELHRRGDDRIVTTLVTTVEVDNDDPALSNPTKPVGSVYDRRRAQQCIENFGWNMVEIAGHGFRRVVPSPMPKRIVEIDLIRRLVEAGEIIVAVGGGGIPVYRDAEDNLEGLEAVIDKDLASGLLAREIDAEALMVLTFVEKVALDFGKPTERTLDRMTVTEAKRHLADGQFPPGSMGPKIRAAIEFVESSARENARVVISNIEHVADALAGQAGTTIVRG